MDNQPLFTDNTAEVELNYVFTKPKKNKEVAIAKTAEEVEEDKDNGGLTAAVEAALQDRSGKDGLRQAWEMLQAKRTLTLSLDFME